jgi:hypothetical protein
LNFGEAQTVVSGITYKPGTKFWLKERDDGSGIVELGMEIETYDADNPDRTLIHIRLIETKSMSWWESASADLAMSLIYSLVLRIEMHEIDEWLRIGGCRYRVPHPVAGDILKNNETQRLLELSL